MLAAKIVYALLDELAIYKACDIEEIVNDPDIYEGILDTLIDLVDGTLCVQMEKFFTD